MFRYSFSRLVLAAMLISFTMGHGAGGCCSSEPVLGPKTETVCPTDSTLTYANFGEQFMTTYCTECHSSTLTGDDRMGAPLFHDFDTQLGIQQVAGHIDQAAGAGPAAVNDQMPQDDPRPTLMERQMLAEWIACGAP